MMYADEASLILAAVPEGGEYVNLIKVGTVVVLLGLWAAATQWVDRDTYTVKTKREQWNVITISGGIVGFIALLVPPWVGPLFFVGLFFWLLLTGGALLAYVLHRNGRVVPAGRVLTKDHLKRIFAPGGGGGKTVKDKGQRVRLEDHKDNPVAFPEDPEEALDYQVLQDFLYDLLWRRVSDVDMLAGREKYSLAYRVDGVASKRPEGIPPEDGERVFRYLKRLAGLNVEELRRPQTGKIHTSLLGDDRDNVSHTMVHASGTTAGERLRLHFDHGPSLLRVKELGLAAQREAALQEILKKPSGMVLITGLPHNGITTTEYAVLRAHDVYMQNIHTLERRALIELDNITQRIYDGHDSDANFARTLQSVIRREPDVVLVGECEDSETAQVATRAAAETRKIYMGMHAKDCFDALSRYLHLVDDNRRAAKALIGVLNQRLIRVLCTQCREAFRPDPATLKKLNLPADKIDRFHRPPTQPLLDKKGREMICPACQGTGYVGRTGLFELLLIDAPVKQLIAEGAAINKIRTQCRKAKMRYMQEEGLLKVIEGTTSMNEILRSLRDNAK